MERLINFARGARFLNGSQVLSLYLVSGGTAYAIMSPKYDSLTRLCSVTYHTALVEM